MGWGYAQAVFWSIISKGYAQAVLLVLIIARVYASGLFIAKAVFQAVLGLCYGLFLALG